MTDPRIVKRLQALVVENAYTSFLGCDQWVLTCENVVVYIPQPHMNAALSAVLVYDRCDPEKGPILEIEEAKDIKAIRDAFVPELNRLAEAKRESETLKLLDYLK